MLPSGGHAHAMRPCVCQHACEHTHTQAGERYVRGRTELAIKLREPTGALAVQSMLMQQRAAAGLAAAAKNRPASQPAGCLAGWLARVEFACAQLIGWPAS